LRVALDPRPFTALIIRRGIAVLYTVRFGLRQYICKPYATPAGDFSPASIFFARVLVDAMSRGSHTVARHGSLA
jgi:hypothetical protein